MRRSQRVEVVPNWNGLNWRVISNRQPPIKLAHREPSRKWGGSEASPPPPGPCAWAGYPLSLPPRRAVGERNAARFFAASVAPSRGVWGTKCCLFLADFSIKKQSRRNSDLARNNSHSTHFSSKTGHCHNSSNLTNDGSATTGRSKVCYWWPGSTPCTDA